uniref:Uncharacterized protein n=1 Tax=Plectus sambesii TaxID=2011161 RepID=A0A914VZ20_9BILA
MHARRGSLGSTGTSSPGVFDRGRARWTLPPASSDSSVPSRQKAARLFHFSLSSLLLAVASSRLSPQPAVVLPCRGHCFVGRRGNRTRRRLRRPRRSIRSYANYRSPSGSAPRGAAGEVWSPRARQSVAASLPPSAVVGARKEQLSTCSVGRRALADERRRSVAP